MTIIETTKMTSKGQVTIPNRVRKILQLQKGSSIAFGVTKDGIVIMPCKVTAESPYSSKEWKKIEKLTSEKGKVFSSAKDAKDHLASLHTGTFPKVPGLQRGGGPFGTFLPLPSNEKFNRKGKDCHDFR
ncbi:MAG: hypothetical protein A3G33_01115 [Omnitrophica bacterium RIFCSPLOWO2_12_FULL_44_17]|uniref:SpoVT-AbrB domain-containing protein n=1 Tax=Candidatus Danuiimicrobium aquiferis TaxID=1801832 RepID=A0A1G1L1M2_9BACT|nr:MAG: hypothetical protein A3B72_02430 [Omnitrophica bacterium RIFCSPHIGHO2_02_FULL_45_28]OGW90594.1 MAG: hypothetical protein A3E74_03760 [Omnitrophica bacterium RIFCSPHIGHO2_12_FULL_44_12]OGW98789.1 MAG: hypothetical protein A3G33_01115 [Omnitrophica bacterium RIFCSPLOWO2_12_FULL_44_17]OGX02495.1 MAG: hypothetical protein A3J12_00225 [Omnitrophica bacterium RIFCSPLOWO2_02_FULL_44_11]